MGNNVSTFDANNKLLKPASATHIMDYIATYYILTMDFDSLKQLYNPEYCNNLIILTSDIVERYFTSLEITYLSQRIKNGQPINELKTDDVIFFNKDDINKLNVQNTFKKKNMCIAISKFYIKIAHLFAAIVTTINPIYVYKDKFGNNVRADLYEKSKIPPNTPRQIYKLNICDNRISALQNKQTFTNIKPDEPVTIQPKICSINSSETGNVRTLSEEPGIPQLRKLYNDDKYNYETGQFDGMSQATKKIFDEDLQIFYTVFTGKNATEMAKDNITDFSDIRLKDYSKDCKKFSHKITSNMNNSLFKDYASHLKDMIQKTQRHQSELLAILDKIFVYTIDPQTEKKVIRVNPAMTETMLQQIVIDTRKIIITLYLSCEMNFTKGIYLYEAIVLQKSLDTAKNQTSNLEQEKERLEQEEEYLEEQEGDIDKKESLGDNSKQEQSS